jgi:hypothetical protein
VISTFIIENYALVRVLLVIAAIACVALTAVLVRMGLRGRRIAGILAAVATVVVLGLTLTADKFPNPGVGCTFDGSTFYYDFYNIVLFFLPVLFATIWARRPQLVLLGGVGLSAVIETVQAFIPVLGRRCDLGDWLANSTGTVLAVLVAAGVTVLVERVRRRS